MINFSTDNPHVNIYWIAMLFLSLAAMAFAVYQIFSFSLLQFLILGISLTITMLINQYQKKKPGTQSVISAREMVVVWGTIWLGVSGAVFLAAGATLIRFFKVSKAKRLIWLFSLFVSVISAFISANVFYLALYYLEGFTKSEVAGNPVHVAALIVATAALTIVHYLLFSMSTSVYLDSIRIHDFQELWKKNAGWTAMFYVIGVCSGLILHFTFLRFGLEFGLIVLPLVVFGDVSYKIHLRRLAQKTKEIREASRIHLATVEALATAIDARDQVGIGHVRRTQIYAVGIGRIMNLSEDELQAINTGALLHDIGKLAVPDNILNKPGRLTPAEMEKTKIHASVGASILEDVEFTYPVVPTVRHHHETWDGTGYPDGLKGNEIPITARILSVADAYDTLRGARPYRPAVSREEARRFLLNGAGTQFDPNIVDLFLRNLRQLEAKVETEGYSYKNKDKGKFESEKSAKNNYVEQIKRANREVFTLYELARVFSSSLNLQDTLKLFVRKIGELVQFDTCVIYLLDESAQLARAAYAEGFNSDALQNKVVKPGAGATGFVLKKRQSVSDINPALDFGFDQLELVEAYSAMASLPLLAEEKMVGAVSIYSCKLEIYGEEQMRLLETVSRIASDAIAMALQHAESENRALTDPMTGLPNARSLQMQFEKEVARAERNGSSFQVLMLDLDGFKFVNDTYGHKIGDKLLKELSIVMQAELRDYDFLARYAGDEFVAIIPETNNSAVRDLCQRIEKAICEFKLDVGDGRFAKVGVSLGASCYPQDGSTVDQIVIAADKRMYEVKAKRKSKKKAAEKPVVKQKPKAARPAAPAQQRPQQQQKSPPPQNQKAPGTPPPSGRPADAAEQIEVTEENFIVEVDESHIISNALN